MKNNHCAGNKETAKKEEKDEAIAVRSELLLLVLVWSPFLFLYIVFYFFFPLSLYVPISYNRTDDYRRTNMNILPAILKNEPFAKTRKASIFVSFITYFNAHIGVVFWLEKHTDPGMKNNTYIRVVEPHRSHVVVEVLDEKQCAKYRTSITYAALLDCDNSGQQHVYEIRQVYTGISVIAD